MLRLKATYFAPACLAVLSNCLAGDAAASEHTANPAAVPASAAADPMALGNLWQLTLGMLLVLGLIAAIAWLLKRSGRLQMAAGGHLRILGGLSMGSRERVVLMQVGEQQLLIGVAPGRVQTLHVLDEPVGTQATHATAGAFADQLARIMGRNKSP